MKKEEKVLLPTGVLKSPVSTISVTGAVHKLYNTNRGGRGFAQALMPRRKR
jgi:hypothetical protein